MFRIGDRVIAVKDIWKDADEHGPASLYAQKGDVLVVRKVGLVWPLNVSHEDRTDCSFGVELDEVQPEICEPDEGEGE